MGNQTGCETTVIAWYGHNQILFYGHVEQKSNPFQKLCSIKYLFPKIKIALKIPTMNR
jgi:hypothetical protein